MQQQPEVQPWIEGEAGASCGPLLFRNVSTAPAPAAEEPVFAPVEPPAPDLPLVMAQAREEGRQEAAALLQAEMDRRLQAERATIGTALEAFLEEKRRYFAGLEKEVVRLSLAIAERVLHREAAMDPTLLAGAARVALEQVDGDSTAVLLVAPGDRGQWQAALPALGRPVELREEPTLERGQCLIQTEAGSFELGLRAQLCEIERGFFELLGRSPVAASA